MTPPTATALVRFAPVLDIAGSLATLGRWGDDGMDRWDGARLLRTARDGSRPVPFLARPVGPLDAPSLQVTAAPAHLAAASATAARMFASAPSGAFESLVSADPAIGRLAAAHPGIRPVLHPDPLTALVRSISAQQINLTFAARLRARLAQEYGTGHSIDAEAVTALDAELLAAAAPEDLRALQFTMTKARSIIAVAQATRQGSLDIDELTAMSDERVGERLRVLPGIGPWTVEWFLARTLGRPRVVAGDLGVRKAVGRAYLRGRLPSEREVRELTAHWGAAAGIAQQLALHDLAVRP